MKLIVFTDPSKLNGLIPDSEFKRRFSNYDGNTGDTTYYSEEVIYIKEDFSFEFGEYNAKTANKSTIIILRDNWSNTLILDNLEEDIYVLKHSQEASLFNQLKDKSSFKGFIEQQEEPNNLHDLLVKSIALKNNGNTNDFIQKNFVNEVNKNRKLDAALDFLHNCLGDCTTKHPISLDDPIFSTCKTQFDAWKKNKTNENLRVLREGMLEIALKN